MVKLLYLIKILDYSLLIYVILQYYIDLSHEELFFYIIINSIKKYKCVREFIMKIKLIYLYNTYLMDMRLKYQSPSQSPLKSYVTSVEEDFVSLK